MASTYLTTTFGTATNQRIGTFSFWIKISKLGSSGDKYIFSTYENDNNRTICKLNGNDKFEFQAISGSNVDLRFDTNRVFRDTNAWYHIVITTDTTLSTAADRVKIYVNGVQETSFSTSTIPTQNIQPHYLYNSLPKVIGAYANGNVNNFDGLMSHIHFTDGTAYDASAFGEYDANGVWKIILEPSVTYGTNGYFILKNGNSVTDQSGNSNNFTVAGGTLTNTEDNPSNVFATMNVLTLSASQVNINKGNLSKTNTPTSNAWRSFYGTLGASSGKYYWEFKVDLIESSDPNNIMVGIVDAEQMVNTANNNYSSTESRGYQYHAQTGNKINNGSQSSYGATYTAGDIIGIAVDLDNHKLYFHKNGTYQNSGDPTSGATGTGSAFDIATGYTYLPAFSQYYGNEHFSVNFGNGYFGTTAVASAGTNASGIGIFEYDVPTGYTALSTTGLNL